jgi:predicted permease
MWEWLRRIRVIVTRRRFERELDDELRFHREMKQQALEEEGLAAPAAREAAVRALGGGTLLLRERARDVWGAPGIEAVAQDVRHAVRLLRRNPGFSFTALGTLALGIGLNTAIFSIVYGVVLKPLAYRDPARLVVVLPNAGAASGHGIWSTFTPADYHELQDANTTLDGIAAVTGTMQHLTGHGEPLQLKGLEATPNVIDVLGVDLQRGRGFRHDDAAGASDADGVIISDRVWRAVFGADPDIVGRAATLDGEARTIVGVLRPDFEFQLSRFNTRVGVDLIVPNTWPERSRRNSFLQVFARLRPDVTPAQADADLTAIARRVEPTVPTGRASAGHAVRVADFHAEVVGQTMRRLLFMLSAAVAILLLIVCVNIANLQLARWSSRRTELSVRLALGAGRRRLVRQLLTESVVLAVAGGALGAAIAYAAVPLLLAQLPTQQLPRMTNIQVSTPVLAFSLVLSMATGIVFGLLPALRQSILSHADDLRGGAVRMTAGRQTERLRAGLVIGQMALTLVLLISAGLLLHSFIRLMGVPTGFNSEGVITVTVTLPDRLYATPRQMQTFTGDVLDRLQGRPGVEAVSAMTMLPFNQFWIQGDFEVEGQPAPRFNVGKPKIGPDYFKTLGIPFLSGRDFQTSDTAGAPQVAIVSAAVATRVWPNQSALGKRIRVDTDHWLTIVGVVDDVRQDSLESALEPTIYMPYQQETHGFFLQLVTFVARTRVPETATSTIRQTIRDVAPDLPIASVATMQALVADSVAQPRMRAMLIGGFALCALLIATLGIYGVMTYAVTQRRREIGIRMAIGAAWADVVWLVLRRALVIVAAGAIIGIGASFAVTRTLTSFLFEVTPNDPLAIAGVTLLLVAVAITAAWLPARRAAQTDPVEALRVE